MKGKAICKCKKCGKSFLRESKKDYGYINEWRAWEAWAEGFFDECSECYKERKENENRERMKLLGVPEITTYKSEKQKSYAESLRAKFLNNVNEAGDFFKTCTDAKEIIDKLLAEQE